MKNKSHSIKNIFITRMAYSAIIQFVIFVFILMFVREYFHNQISSFSKNLIINDSFTSEEIGRYHLLNNKDALDLVLLNIGNERKLDSIKFIPFPHYIEDLGSCEDKKSGNFTCKSKSGQLSGVTVLKNNGSILGYVVAKKLHNSIYAIPTSYSLLLILVIVVGIFLFNFLFLFLSMRKKIASNTEHLLHFISSHKANNTVNFSKIKIDEYIQIAHKFIDKHNEIINLQQEKAFYEAKKNLAEQLAHDIRSPLTAINIAVFDVSSISENKRIMIRNASNRINDIANNLLLQSKDTLPESQITHKNINNSPELIFVVIDAIVSEKRYEYYSTGLNLELKSSEDSYGCFSLIDLGYFKRILSNLINNSIEAIDQDGSILISVTCNDSQIEIIIEDDGCGIPSDILPKVTNLGFSFNKKEGAGIGLSYVKQHLHSMNGTIKIESEESNL
jgi:signal transduction histidine kinase